MRLGFRQTAYLSLATLPAWFPQDSLPSIYRVTVVSQGWLCAASSHQAWFGKAEVSTFPSFADKVRARGKHPPPQLLLLCTLLKEAYQSPVSAY